MITVDVIDDKTNQVIQKNVGFLVLPRQGELFDLDGIAFVVRLVFHFPANSKNNIELYVVEDTKFYE